MRKKQLKWFPPFREYNIKIKSHKKLAFNLLKMNSYKLEELVHTRHVKRLTKGCYIMGFNSTFDVCVLPTLF